MLPIYKNSGKCDNSNYRGISLLHITYKHLSNTSVSRVTIQVDKLTGQHKCGFWRNESTDQILSVCQILKKQVGIKM